MDFSIPQPLKTEHDELHEDLARAIQAGGRTGAVAREVANLLHPHFVKEEEFALPPLGLLARVARNEEVFGAADAVAMADRLRSELPRMLAEHQEIVTALGALTSAALEEGHNEHARFAQKLILHARTEEEVLYPAAILLGEYLKLKGKA
jgi:hypothetical protein